MSDAILRSSGTIQKQVYQLKQDSSEPLYDQQLILDLLDSQTKTHLSSLTILDTVDSTSNWLFKQAIPPVHQAHVCLAEMQTAGRGRHGRTWFSPFAQNIYMSMSWAFPELPQNLLALSPASALTLCNLINKLGFAEVAVKWPNDLVCHNRKLAGVLLETVYSKTGLPARVVIGVGFNHGMKKDEQNLIDQPWISLQEISNHRLPSRSELAAYFVNSLIDLLVNFSDSHQKGLLADWNSHDALLHKHVMMQQGQNQWTGIYRGIDMDGSALLENAGQLLRFQVGEMSLRSMNPMTAGFDAYGFPIEVSS